MGYMVHWEQLHFSDFTWSNVLKLVPKVVNCQFLQTEWGFVLSTSDDNSAYIERYPTQITGSKTNRLALTKELMKTLILMVEFGAAKGLDHDDSDMSMFLNALEEVHDIHPLMSYEEQKAYFLSVKNY
jgi:hypothetical protein